MSVRLAVEGDTLAVRLAGWDQLWALTTGVTVPLSAVRRVEVVRRVDADARAGGYRLPGTFLPGVVRAGRYRSIRSGRSLWCVHRADRVLLVELAGQPYEHLVLEVPAPEAECHALARALARALG